jgi:hypothetical protein
MVYGNKEMFEMLLIQGGCGKDSIISACFLVLLKTSVKQEVIIHGCEIDTKLIWMKLLKLLY